MTRSGSSGGHGGSLQQIVVGRLNRRGYESLPGWRSIADRFAAPDLTTGDWRRAQPGLPRTRLRVKDPCIIDEVALVPRGVISVWNGVLAELEPAERAGAQSCLADWKHRYGLRVVLDPGSWWGPEPCPALLDLERELGLLEMHAFPLRLETGEGRYRGSGSSSWTARS